MARAAALLRRAFVFAAVALLLSPAALADDASDVITLTAANFDAVVNKEKIIVRARLLRARQSHQRPCSARIAWVVSRAPLPSAV